MARWQLSCRLSKGFKQPPLRLSITSAPQKLGGWPQRLPVPTLLGIAVGCSRDAGRTWPSDRLEMEHPSWPQRDKRRMDGQEGAREDLSPKPSAWWLGSR